MYLGSVEGLHEGYNAKKSSMLIRVSQRTAGIGQTVRLRVFDPNGPLGDWSNGPPGFLLGSIIGPVDNWAESFGTLECWALLGAH